MSGGVKDAKGLKDEFPHYRYGGMVSGSLFAEKLSHVSEGLILRELGK